jgi:hypothetical protein
LAKRQGFHHGAALAAPVPMGLRLAVSAWAWASVPMGRLLSSAVVRVRDPLDWSVRRPQDTLMTNSSKDRQEFAKSNGAQCPA